ncbi:tetratricopeptide repeat protein [Wenyingzhuangia sp. IMCC45574]
MFSQENEPKPPLPSSEISPFSGSEKKVQYIEKLTNQHKKAGDSIAYLKSKLQLIATYANTGKYHKAYDLAWKMHADIRKNIPIDVKADILIRLTRLYILFEQKEKANQTFYTHYKDLKKLIKTHKDSLYLDRTLDIMRANLEYELNKNYPLAETILLNNIQQGLHKNTENIGYYYSQWQLSKLYLITYRIEEARELLFKLKNEFSSQKKHINILIYYQLGDLFRIQKNNKKAIAHYEKSLELMNQRELHADFKLDILDRLSDLYFQEKKTNKAYTYLLKSKRLGTQLFGSKSNQNKTLFELNNKFEEKFNRQQLLVLQQEKRILNLKITIYTCGFLVIILFLVIYFVKKSKHNKQIQQQLKLEQAKKTRENEIALESKNKELLSSAMQLIERDGMLEDLKKQLNTLHFNEENKPIIQKILKSLKINRSQKWKEFDAHFTNLNSSFFDNLKVQFPQLTKTDLKICAFINLGFSSKDISQIMGIGVESLNVSRSRLRKKMNLNRDVNLNTFLEQFSS